jgi:3-dehydroquinate synthase
MKLHSDRYSVHFGRESLTNIQSTILENGFTSVFILCDEKTEELCLPYFVETSEIESAGLLIIEQGEEGKNFDTVNDICESLLSEGADRKTLLINLGGGVVSDIGGFVASIYKRGISYINVPTTLLSMVDAAIGGKTGVNLNQVKNAVGTFNAPHSVYIDPEFLTTLEQEEFRSGFAEVIKHSLISDEKYWKLISSIKDITEIENLISVIHRSVEIKMAISGGDFNDTGSRKILNFGHTFGHAYESSSMKSGSNKLRHGHAVALGMIGELFLSSKLAGFPTDKLESIIDFIIFHFGSSFMAVNEDELQNFLFSDKKNENGKIGFFLLKDIGKGAGMFFPEEELIQEALAFTSSIITE